jgi:SAM-dependent methyltransferase
VTVTAAGTFGAQASDYRSFRPRWPAEVLARVLACVPEPRRRAVDLGAGTGLATELLLPHFASVVAVEPDARMSGQMNRAPGLRVVTQRAEDALFEPGSLDLVTTANAFHWMEGERVCELVHGWLRPGGLYAVFRYDPPHAGRGALAPVLDLEWKRWHEHVHPRLEDPDYTRRTVAASRLGVRMDVVRIANPLPLTLAELVGFSRSTSYGGSYARSQPDPEAYWADFEERVLADAGSGPFTLDFHMELLLAPRVD